MTTHGAVRQRARVTPWVQAVAVLVLTLLSFFQYPGHTFLQSDTQIYVPILEHLHDPSVLANDIVAVRPHVRYTVYDEVALGARRITGLSFETILQAQQFAYRALGIWGLLLLAGGLGLSRGPALLVAAFVSLGAAIHGPMVLTVEYEPVPRGFALPFVLLSMGMFAQRRPAWSAAAAAVAFLFHPPTVLAFCAVLVPMLALQRQWRAIGVLACGPAILLLSALAQPAAPETPELLRRIDPALEALQRMRVPYTWVSLWIGRWWLQYALLTAVFLVAYFRVRDLLQPPLRLLLLAMPAIGWLSVPVSYVLLERWKWSLITQYQPSRYLLYVTLFAVIACAIAAARAAWHERYVEASLFWFVPALVPSNPDLLNATAFQITGAAVIAVLAALSARRRFLTPVAALAPFLLIPWVAAPAPAQTRRVDELAAWARSATPADAVFQFAGAGRGLEPGVFRARASRSIWADWKGGGQVNFLPSFAALWAERWAVAKAPRQLPEYRGLGIDYVVFRSDAAPRDQPPVYRDNRWTVFRVER